VCVCARERQRDKERERERERESTTDSRRVERAGVRARASDRKQGYVSECTYLHTPWCPRGSEAIVMYWERFWGYMGETQTHTQTHTHTHTQTHTWAKKPTPTHTAHFNNTVRGLGLCEW